MRHKLGELPRSLAEERSQKGKRILDPGMGYVADWTNRYTQTLFPFQIGLSAQRILPANPMRTYLIIQNKSAGVIFVNFGQNPTPTSSITIIAGGNYELIGGAAGGSFVPPDDVYVLGDALALNCIISEGLWQSVSI